MSKRSRSDEDTVPDTEVGQLNAMDESMPGQIEAIVARDQFNACVVAAKNSVAEAEQKTEAMKEEMANWEEEKTRIANTHNFEPTVTLSVGGNIFTTTTSTLTRYPETMLGAMFSGRHALIQDKNGAYFIDRDGRHFHEILNFLRGSTASTPESMAQLSPRSLEELRVEADFYGMKDLMFPTPPFKSANPVVIKSMGGCNSTVTQASDTFPRTKIVTGSTIRKKSFMDFEENFYSRATKDDEDIEEPDDSHSRGRSSQKNSSSSNHQQQQQQQQQQHNYQHHYSSNNNGVNRKSIAVTTHDGLSSMLSEGNKQQPVNPAADPYHPLTTTAKKQSSNSRGKQQQSQQSILQTTNGNKSRDENDSITRTNNHAAAATAAAQPKSQPYRNAKKSDKKVPPLVIDLAGDSDDNSDDDVEVCNDDRMDVGR